MQKETWFKPSTALYSPAGSPVPAAHYLTLLTEPVALSRLLQVPGIARSSHDSRTGVCSNRHPRFCEEPGVTPATETHKAKAETTAAEERFLAQPPQPETCCQRVQVVGSNLCIWEVQQGPLCLRSV